MMLASHPGALPISEESAAPSTSMVGLMRPEQASDIVTLAQELDLGMPPLLREAMALSSFVQNPETAMPARAVVILTLEAQSTLDVAAVAPRVQAICEQGLSSCLAGLSIGDEEPVAAAAPEAEPHLQGAICVCICEGSATIQWVMVRPTDAESPSSPLAVLLSGLEALLAPLAAARVCTTVGASVSTKNYLAYLAHGFTELGWRNTDGGALVRMGKQLTSESPSAGVCAVVDRGTHPLSSMFRFDTILSADTLYSESTMPTLIRVLRQLLHRTGHALIAAKRYYFGVGGSTAAFRQLLARYGDMSCELVAVYEDGASNIREILCVRWM
jgi:hypothetical protein